MGDEDELDFEEGENEQVDYFCGICIDCFDEKKEFLEHITSSSHKSAKSNKLSQLKEGQKYCSHCCTVISHEFEDHCKTNEHVEFVKCLKVVLPDFTPPIVEVVPLSEVIVKSTPEIKSRSPSGLVDRIRTKKCIGIPHVERIDDGWFCGLCLEDFDTDLIIHCLKAQHAIQCVKTIDPHTALQLKKFALNNKDKFKELISTKAKEIFDQEKITEKFKAFMLDLEKEQAKYVKDLSEHPKEVTTPMETSQSTTAESECVISIFEEADREIIPDAPTASAGVEDSRKRSSSKGPSSSNHHPVKCKDSTMVIGIKYIVKKGRDYWCDLCDIRCKNNPPSCRNHVTGSLHRRNLITRDQPQPIPKYLQALRSSSPHLYGKILINESMKLEIKEREGETKELQELRARILQVKIHNLPPNLCTGTGRDCPGPVKEDDTYNISILAGAWDDELSKKLSASFIKKEKKEVPIVASEPIPKPPEQKKASPPKRTPVKDSPSSSLITPIQPDEKNLLVGLNEIVQQSNGQYECRMCNIKFSSRKTWSQKSHITGRLHKVKALATRYGTGVEKYLDFKMKKSGYNSLMPEINKACVMLEQQEIETETTETRSLRADILGVRVERLPLPLITLQKDPPYDIQKIAQEWTAKQSPSQPPKQVEGKKETPSRAAPKVEVKKLEPKVETDVENTEEEPTTSGLTRDVPIVETDKVPAPDAIISNPNANPPMIKQEQKSQVKPREDSARKRLEAMANNKRKTPPSHLLPKPSAPAKPSPTPQQPRTRSPARNQQTRRTSPQRNQQNRKPSPHGNQQNRKPSPQRNQQNRRPSPQRNQQARRPSPQRNAQTRRPSPQRNQQARRPSPQRNQQARRPSPQRNQQARRPSPQRNQNRAPSPQRGQQNRGPSPQRGQQNQGPSPQRNQHNQGPSPQRNPPNRSTSPQRSQQNRGPSPHRNQQNRRPSPQRNQQNRGPSPQRNQQNRGPSPQRNQQNRGPSPQRNQQNRGPSPQRNQQNRGARRSPPRNNPNLGPNNQRITSPIRNDRQQPNRRPSPPRNEVQDTPHTQGSAFPPRNGRNSNPRQNTFNSRKSSPPRDTSGRYSPPEPQMSRPQQPQQPQQNNFQNNNFANTLQQTIDPQTRSTILQATRDAIAKVFDRNNTTGNLGNQVSPVVPMGSPMMNQNGAQVRHNAPMIPNIQQSQNFHQTPKNTRPFSSFPDNNQMFNQSNNMMNHQNMGNNMGNTMGNNTMGNNMGNNMSNTMGNNMGSSVSNMPQTFVGDKRPGPYPMDQNAKRFRDNNLNFR